MANQKKGVAKLFRNGRSQAVRLPREFRFEGDCVRIRSVKQGVLLEPVCRMPGNGLPSSTRFRTSPS